MFLKLLLLHYFFNFQPKIFQKRKKKINNDSLILLILISLHYLLIFALYMISEIFDLKGKFVYGILRLKNNLVIFLLIFTILFITCSVLVLNFYDREKIQILNFLFSFLLIFEVCIKISNSEKFISWIGENLDRSFRLFIMFIISLNCTYFFTRLTLQVLKSS